MRVSRNGEEREIKISMVRSRSSVIRAIYDAKAGNERLARVAQNRTVELRVKPGLEVFFCGDPLGATADDLAPIFSKP